VNGREISGLKEQIGSLKEQIGSLTQQIGALEQRRLRAIEQLTVDKKKMETLREEVAALKKKIPKGGRHNELATSVDAVTSTQFQSGGFRPDSPVRVRYAQPASQSPRHQM
jgi:chromosome segregation ATPase